MVSGFSVKRAGVLDLKSENLGFRAKYYCWFRDLGVGLSIEG